MDEKTERPTVHCLIAWPKGDHGDVRRMQRVPLSTAEIAFKAGLYVVGPDPEDMEELAAWEREHTFRQSEPFEPFNPPKVSE